MMEIPQGGRLQSMCAALKMREHGLGMVEIEIRGGKAKELMKKMGADEVH
jgi:hypothetical protein